MLTKEEMLSFLKEHLTVEVSKSFPYNPQASSTLAFSVKVLFDGELVAEGSSK